MSEDYVILPLAGMDQSVDPHVLPHSFFEIGKNVYAPKTGGFAKRHGFAEVSMDDLVESQDVIFVRSMFATDRELCIVTNDSLMVKNDVRDGFRNAGKVSPIALQERVMFRDHRSYDQCDLAISDQYMLLAGHSKRYTTPSEVITSTETAIDLRVMNGTDQVVIPTFTCVSGTSSETRPWTVQCVYSRFLLYALYVLGDTGDSAIAGALKVIGYDSSTPNTPPVVLATPITTDIYVDTQSNSRRYDSVSLTDTTIAIAWVLFSTTDIRIDRRSGNNPTTAALDTTTITGDFRNVAICQDTNNVYILSRSAAGSVDVYSLDKATWTVGSPLNLDTGVTGEDANLGIVATSTRLYMVWNKGSFAKSRNCLLNLSGLSSAIQAVNTSWRSKPFVDVRTVSAVQFTEVFAAACTSQEPEISSSGDEATLVTAGVIARISGVSKPELLAVYDVGQGPIDREFQTWLLGSNNNVYLGPDGKIHLGVTTLQSSMEGVAERFGAEELLIEMYPERITACSIANGAAVIGGGFVAYYDGNKVHELGFLHAPHYTAAAADLSFSPGLPDGSYNYILVFEDYDKAGNFHRSAPGAPLPTDVVVAGSDDAIIITPLSLSFTYRETVGIQVYRADASGVYLRITEPLITPQNKLTTSEAETYTDVDQGVEQDPLYVTTGELEAVITESATVAAVSNNRLKLCGLARGERALYSKVLQRGTASQPLAPEMNDALAIATPSADRVTAVGSLGLYDYYFTSKFVYSVVGSGPDDGGLNNQFSDPTRILCDSGSVEPRGVVSYPDGLFYPATKGIYHIDKKNDITFKGAAVKDLTDAYPVITSAVLVDKYKHVRFTCVNEAGTEGVIIVYDYRLGAWLGSWEISHGLSTRLPFIGACVYAGEYYVVTKSGILLRETDDEWLDDTDIWIPYDITFSWVQFFGQNGWGRLQKVTPMLEQSNQFDIDVKVQKNFSTSITHTGHWTNTELATFTSSPTKTVQLHCNGLTQKGHAWRVNIVDAEPSSPSGQVTGQGFVMSGVRLDYMVLKGPVKVGKAQHA